MDAEELEFLKKTMRKKSRHAGYWEEPDKRGKEVGVVEDLLIAICKREGRDWIKQKSVESSPSSDRDAPDVIGETKTGVRVAFEVTELVDEKMIGEHIKGQPESKDWQLDEIISRLQAIIAKKERVDYGGKIFGLIILVIHTAEKEITAHRYGSAIAAHQFAQQGQIDKAYLLFKPWPMSQTCSYSRLSFR